MDKKAGIAGGCGDLHYFGFLLHTETVARGRQLLTP
jgi:hypothetical protein